MCNRLD